eukprot:5611402-Pyramimonas_sp.AAC.1
MDAGRDAALRGDRFFYPGARRARPVSRWRLLNDRRPRLHEQVRVGRWRSSSRRPPPTPRQV